MPVNAETDKLPVEIVNGVEMLKEEATEQEVAIVVAVQGVLGDGELADALTLMEVPHWLHLEDGVVYLEGDGLDLLCEFVAGQLR